MQGAKCNKAKLSETKQKILSLIIWKLVQAVQPPFIYEDVLVTVCCQGRNFTAKYKEVLQLGYTAKPVPLVEMCIRDRTAYLAPTLSKPLPPVPYSFFTNSVYSSGVFSTMKL